MITKKSKETLKALDEGVYRNTKEVVLGGVKYSAKDILIKAPLISSLNMYYVGGTGEGKTQLANDLVSHMGEDTVYAMGRNDFEPSQLMRQVNWELLKAFQSGEKISEGDLEKITQNVNKIFFYVDEFNRCKPIVQNYFFDFFDGKYVHTDGKIYKLGKAGYSIGFASGNLGDGDYVGISDSDRAMKDRMHMIVSLDNPLFRPTPFDALMIYSGNKKNPRASLPKSGIEITEDIIDLNKEFQESDLNPIYPLIGVFLSEGLDYLPNTKRHSKRAIESTWKHSNLEGINVTNDEGKIFPLSKRAILSAQGLASALEFIAEAEGNEIKKPVELLLDSLKLTIPYSGILHPTYVDQVHSGDVYSAFDDVFSGTDGNSGLNKEIKDRAEQLELSIHFAEAGEEIPSELINDIFQNSQKWMPVVDSLKDYAKFRNENPSENGIKLKQLIENAKKVDEK